jgi:hypothetical protein
MKNGIAATAWRSEKQNGISIRHRQRGISSARKMWRRHENHQQKRMA